MPAGTEDLVALLKADHKTVEALLAAVDSTAESAIVEYFCKVREELVRHEVAEELVVYPAFRRNVPGADAVADARIAEQSEAEEALARLDKQEDDPAALRSGLVKLRGNVLAHAIREEQEVFPLLESHTGTEELQELGRRYEKALAAAPTHPHPHAPDSPPGNIVLGPVAALVDRVRDAMKRSS
ncbi:MAG: hemerythrin protein [Acidimicrobiaceae bacterium]|nr:hemerythrin protein [Acidimicrobiaceae bacterium]